MFRVIVCCKDNILSYQHQTECKKYTVKQVLSVNICCTKPIDAQNYTVKFGIKLKNITFAPTIVLWCNGSTTVFGSVSGGSNPPGTTQKIRGFFMILRIF